ncbi:5,6-dimethylbenzimidazole synthase [Zhongshania aliphaticivorans]|uniref:5,6-dimethylbenzimidazole synthase n=1 Tax=Zhongshania aliphaticivorans TaxID=1470434 RepID=A0A5S9QIW0_9GAMM|nr:5,6-dimethylbenzimidazole synthase [Zhongshania aliphaticivorans]CAA0109741.1 5,6-dimethylbenzimidazole synthase [Zhongshania aliphaticivorans]CAA0117882.1 5,6-dimethylbenzimidazole synthase [Zhongshania aliphaticivorans]CAA0121629.1 5,6-dimethylbenzimidazole synthase [Zhongshania aliphaticivorans]
MNKPNDNALSYKQADRDAIYRVIAERRDMRHFIGGEVEESTLKKLLAAAHLAPSVGFMQPWRFIRVRKPELREAIYQLVQEERIKTAQALSEREDEFMQLKVEGIKDCAELLVVCLMDGREKYVFGRRTLPEMDLASASCAIQNLWLAARAEGLGMGWVSLFDPLSLQSLLRMPEGSRAIAVLCLGPVEAFYSRPMLEIEQWAKRQNLDELIMHDGWQDQ